MENHPIPQDVTGFQFRLIGDMTVKQFAYIGAGAVFAWMFYVILPLPGFFKILFAALIGCVGVALAFLPIEGRPLDVMMTHFFKSLFSPNQYVFRKAGGHLIVTIPQHVVQQTQQIGGAPNISAEELQTFLKSLRTTTNSPGGGVDQKEAAFLQSLSTNYVPSAPVPQPAPQTPVQEPTKPKAVDTPHQPITFTMESISKPVTSQAQPPIQEPVIQQAPTPQAQPQQPIPEQKPEPQIDVVKKEAVLDLNEQMRIAMAQKQQLEDELAALQRKLATQKQQVYTPTVVNGPPQQTTNVKMVATPIKAKTGAPPTPDVPNLITGVIKNPRGGVLPNILVEVKDKEGNPVRAFKTNQLGQFASATPLANGLYTIEFEDPKEANKFDTVELAIQGEIILPMEVTSIDAREELRKSLFN